MRLALSFFIYILASWSNHAASTPLDLGSLSRVDGHELGQYLDVWDNRGEPADPAAVFAGSLDHFFKTSSQRFPSAGFTEGEFWARIVIMQRESGAGDLLLESRYVLIDELTLYQQTGTGDFSALSIGDNTSK
ncbi:MAG: hypothetical protein M3Q07_05680, partial [Pseudobdellovibrionaceae bacterium]|nr:hypothetical protein [Pseudobdellovibrionaceae bacterium]